MSWFLPLNKRKSTVVTAVKAMIAMMPMAMTEAPLERGRAGESDWIDCSPVSLMPSEGGFERVEGDF